MTTVIKRTILAGALMTAFAVAVVQADTAKTCTAKDSQKSGCCPSKTAEKTSKTSCGMTKTSGEAKGGCCPFSAGKSSCKAMQKTSLPSPKASDSSN